MDNKKNSFSETIEWLNNQVSKVILRHQIKQPFKTGDDVMVLINLKLCRSTVLKVLDDNFVLVDGPNLRFPFRMTEKVNIKNVAPWRKETYYATVDSLLKVTFDFFSQNLKGYIEAYKKQCKGNVITGVDKFTESYQILLVNFFNMETLHDYFRSFRSDKNFTIEYLKEKRFIALHNISREFNLTVEFLAVLFPEPYRFDNQVCFI